ncbi:guanine nucleotide binding protein, alpha subunit [Russula ochroleuca]|uniref:Guanine nucleotide binding protein, alpha subunit n=1 Tax=Russula ochroleuca TaxID=152965 RepID=A0A9P5MSL3_9AGAM|nr:guanine nucleotide binding protein, alpha subunit [Russula ochroleuca]
MRIYHGTFTHEELTNFREVIRRILLRNSRSIVMAIRSQNLGPTTRSNEANCEYIMNYRIDTDSPELSSLPKFGRAVQDLWVEEISPMLLDDPSRLTVDDNAAYFFIGAQRIAAEEYVPSSEDIRHAAERGIMETYFNRYRSSIRVLQIYRGQEWEPRKWIHLFEGVTSIIFYASLSDYDKWVVDRDEQTRLHKSFILFDAVVNSVGFHRTSIILLLTDKAEFGTKLHKVPLAQYFPEYAGSTDVDDCVAYILRRFVSLKPPSGRRPLYSHITETRDTQILRLVIASVEDIILQNAIEDSNIL